MPHAREFAAAAEALAGVRWRRHGRNPVAGLDCGGLPVASLAAVGIVAADSRDYDAAMPPAEFLWRMCRSNGVEQPWGDAGEGRLALCSWGSVAEPRHLAIMLARRRIVHVDAAVRPRRVVVVPASWLDGKLVAVFRMHGLDYGAPW